MLKTSLIVGALALAGALMATPATAQTASADLFIQKTGPWSDKVVQHAATNPCSSTPCRAMSLEIIPAPPVPDGVTIIPALGESGDAVTTDYVPILDKPQSIGTEIARGDYIPIGMKDMGFISDDKTKLVAALAAAERMVAGTYAWDLSDAPKKQ